MIFEALEQLLREVFIDVQERHVAFSLGDLFGTARKLRLEAERDSLLTVPCPRQRRATSGCRTFSSRRMYAATSPAIEQAATYTDSVSRW
jgi:hypothetical protein